MSIKRRRTRLQTLGPIVGCAIALLTSSCQLFLPQSTPDSSQDITQLLQDLEEKRNIETCDGKRAHRVAIARQLGELGEPQAIAPLINILSSPDESVLARGANGCQPGSKLTYPAALSALGQFGPQAHQATPRLLEMLREQEHSRFTPHILETLVKIDSNNELLPLFAPIFGEVAPSTDHLEAYLNTLIHFEDDLYIYSELLKAPFQQIDMSALSKSGKVHLLEGLLYSGGFETSSNQVEALLFDLETLQSINVEAFSGETQAILSQVITLLENFDTHFSDAEFLELKAFCGPSNLEGAKNHIRSRIFSMLIAICTPESLAAVRDYKQKHEITGSCETSLNLCSTSSL